jgi:hypothetical protein
MHIDDKPEERQHNNDTAVLHVTPLSRIRANENADIRAKQVSKHIKSFRYQGKSIHILKKHHDFSSQNKFLQQN